MERPRHLVGQPDSCDGDREHQDHTEAGHAIEDDAIVGSELRPQLGAGNRIGLDGHHDDAGRYLGGLIDLVAKNPGEEHRHGDDERRVAELQSHVEKVVAQLALARERCLVGFCVLLGHTCLSSRIPASHLENGRIQEGCHPVGLQLLRCSHVGRSACRPRAGPLARRRRHWSTGSRCATASARP